MEKYDAVKRSKREIIWNNFLGGIAWGLGTTLGVAVVVTFLGFILKQIHLVPFIGDFVTQIMQYVKLHQ